MFKWLNKQGVRSDKGFVVQCTGRFEVEYREEKRRISIYVEPGYLGDKFCLIINSKGDTTKLLQDQPSRGLPGGRPELAIESRTTKPWPWN
jgi:hypothetical protein